jgi:thymidylate kinase
MILSVPVEVSMQRIIARGRPIDNHEKDKQHLEKAKACYEWLAKKYPTEYVIVECVESNGYELTPEEIHQKVWKIVEERIYNK